MTMKTGMTKIGVLRGETAVPLDTGSMASRREPFYRHKYDMATSDQWIAGACCRSAGVLVSWHEHPAAGVLGLWCHSTSTMLQECWGSFVIAPAPCCRSAGVLLAWRQHPAAGVLWFCWHGTSTLLQESWGSVGMAPAPCCWSAGVLVSWHQHPAAGLLGFWCLAPAPCCRSAGVLMSWHQYPAAGVLGFWRHGTSTLRQECWGSGMTRSKPIHLFISVV